MKHSSRGDGERGAALAAALIATAVAAALVAGLTDVVRTEVILARERRSMAAALAAADACIAQHLATLPFGWDLDALLLGPDGVRGTSDDGTITTPPGCTGSVARAPGPADPPHVLLSFDAAARGGRRLVDAVVARDRTAATPALVWTTLPPSPGAVTGTLALDGADADPASPDLPGLAVPAPPADLDGWLATEGPHIAATPRTQAPVRALPPPLAELVTRAEAAGPGGAELLAPQGGPSSPPVLALVRGDLVVADMRQGAGFLIVEGALDIRGALDFTGVVVAAGGVKIAGGATLGVTGALWLGAPGAPSVPLTVVGRMALRQSRAAVEAADGLLALPRRAVLRGLRDVG